MLYFKIKKLIKGKLSFDRHVGELYIHYNIYDNAIELKSESFEVVEQIPITFFKFLHLSPRAKYYLKRL